jgi:hypothetical protein
MNSFFYEWTRFILTTVNLTAPASSKQITFSSSSSLSSSSIAMEKELEKQQKLLEQETKAKFFAAIKPMFTWEKLFSGHSFKTIETPLMIMKCLFSFDPQLISLLSTDSLVQSYHQQLLELEKIQFSTKLFQFKSKHVIVLEGLKNSGKTAVIQQLLSSRELANQNNANDEWEYESIGSINYEKDNLTSIHMASTLQSLNYPEIVLILFYFLENYRKCLEILSTTTTANNKNCFIVENYYHSFFVNQILYNQKLTSLKKEFHHKTNGDDQESFAKEEKEWIQQYPSVQSLQDLENKGFHPQSTNFQNSSTHLLYDWPLDLPMPELVSFYLLLLFYFLRFLFLLFFARFCIALVQRVFAIKEPPIPTK